MLIQSAEMEVASTHVTTSLLTAIVDNRVVASASIARAGGPCER